jgi:PAS domain S-box-containing protein
MILNIILVINFILLGVTVLIYVKHSLDERRYLKSEAGRGLELQQKVYQIQVLKEISERIGYSLDTSKIIEIITSSLGQLLEYDTVSSLTLVGDAAEFKCHIENSISHKFVDDVKTKILQSISAILNKPVDALRVEESITGNIIDDSNTGSINSFFNLPVIISGKLIGLINVASTEPGLYGDSQAAILYSITNQAANAVSKLQEVLDAEKGKLSSVINSMTDGVIMVSRDNQLLVFNPSIRELLWLGNKPEISMFDIVDSLAGKVDIRTKIDQALAESKPIVINEVYIRDRALELTVTPVRDQSGEKLGAAAVFHDITTEKSLEKLRQEFTAMMVHELRAPLTAVRWSSESLKKLAETNKLEPVKAKETAYTIETASTNMLELVNDLLDVAKIEAGKFEINKQDYDLVGIIKDAIQVFMPQAQMKHLALNIITPEVLKVQCDKVRIGQVLNNLISNAIKYTDSGQVDIGAEVQTAKSRVVVSIKDSGVGVSREDLAQLFSKFKQLKSADNARKGTGLGLVVSKGIVEAHGGQIWAESAGENMGTTFYFSIPM